MTYFESTAKIVRAVDQYDRTGADERALRETNRFRNWADAFASDAFHRMKAQCEAAERKGWMDAAAWLEREGDQHGANLLRAEKGPQG